MARNKYASIDFEYYDTAENSLKLVCCSIRYENKTHNYWLHDNSGFELLIKKISEIYEHGVNFLAYSVTAEARCFLTMGLDPMAFKWIDLYLEYRCLSNHNDKYSYGKQMIKGRKLITKKPPPKYKRDLIENDESKYNKQEYGLGAATYKTLNLCIDNAFKDEIRNIIIACNSGDPAKIKILEERKDDIMRYCSQDVCHLEPMWFSMLGEYKRLLGFTYSFNKLKKDVEIRAEFACRTAKMEALGYPIDFEKTKNFSGQVSNIVWACQVDISDQFTFYKERIFRAKVKSKPLSLSWDQNFTIELVKEWIKEKSYKGWPRTDTGQISLSLKAFSKPVTFSHSYPRRNLLAQMQRYLKLKQGLNGFLPSKPNKKSFWDSVGKDHRVRPFFGIYGAQSARSQASATSFIPLKAAWMRSLIVPKKGKAICGIDFASQEFLVAALLSKDKNMLKAYQSGDVYLAFGKSIRYIPQEATKVTHKHERDNCKALILGLQFDMSEYGLATRLTEAFNRKVEPEEALLWIEKHKKEYPVFWAWKAKILTNYKLSKHIRLADGWYMWGCNDNHRSIGNVPIQGMGSCIMRKAVALAQDVDLKVIYTLHDALYIEYNVDDCYSIELLAACMDEAFRFYFDEDMKEKAYVRLDADIWGLDFSKEIVKYDTTYTTDYGNFPLGVKQQHTYIDERAQDDYDRFNQYFNKVDYSKMRF